MFNTSATPRAFGLPSHLADSLGARLRRPASGTPAYRGKAMNERAGIGNAPAPLSRADIEEVVRVSFTLWQQERRRA